MHFQLNPACLELILFDIFPFHIAWVWLIGQVSRYLQNRNDLFILNKMVAQMENSWWQKASFFIASFINICFFLHFNLNSKLFLIFSFSFLRFQNFPLWKYYKYFWWVLKIKWGKIGQNEMKFTIWMGFFLVRIHVWSPNKCCGIERNEMKWLFYNRAHMILHKLRTFRTKWAFVCFFTCVSSDVVLKFQFEIKKKICIQNKPENGALTFRATAALNDFAHKWHWWLWATCTLLMWHI